MESSRCEKLDFGRGVNKSITLDRWRTVVALRFKHLLWALFVLWPQVSQSQNFDRGFVPYQSYQSSGLESVNVANGNLLLHIPIISYPQRGDLPPFTLLLRYNNPRWVIQYNSYVGFDGATHYAAYWQHDGSSILIARDNTYTATSYNYTPDFGYPTSAAHAVDSSGAHHILETTGDPNNPNSLRESIDASGLRVDTGHITIGAGGMGYVPVGEPDGVTHEVPYFDPTIYPVRTLENGFLDTTQDPNGNHITPQVANPGSTNYTVTGWVDSVGRLIPASHQPLSPNGSPPSFCETLNFPAVNGGTAPMTFCYSVISQQSPFSVPWAGFASANNSTWLSSVTLPNGTAWLFGYNSFGELSSITLPTGGVISYTWTNSALCNSTINNPAMPNSTDWYSPTPVVCDRVVATRTVNANDGTSPATWGYSIGYPNSPYTTVTDPAGNDTLHTFSFSYAQSPYETTTQYFSGPQGNNILLKRVDQQYQNLNYDANLCPAYDGQADGMTHGPAVVPLSTTITWPSGQVSQTTFVYDSGAVFNVVDAGQATHSCPLIYGSLVQRSDYDFGSGTPGSLIRQTSMQYVWQSNSGFLNANLLDRVASVTVRNGNLNQVANTTYGYDENNGSPQGVLGNQTSVTHWLNGGSSPKSQTVYNAQGMPSQRIDANLNVTTITYDSSGLFPSKIQLPDTSGVHHIDNYVYDGNTGLLTSHTGQNGEVTTYAYDNMRRVTGITYPTGGGTESYSYNDQTPFPSFTYTRQIDSSANFVEVGVVNGLGRPHRRQITSDLAGVDTTDTAYDILGRVASVSNPYRSTSDTTYGFTSYQYDALGRITQVTKQDGSISRASYAGNCTTATDEAGKSGKSCTDGLGRLTNVSEDPSGLNYETDYQYDPLGNLLRVDQKGSASSDSSQWRTRTFTYDSLSRLLTANNPESGLIAYQYDNDSNLISKTDARGIATSYTYDALHRLTKEQYSDGSSPREFFYDVTPPFNYNAPNHGSSIGRLTHASNDVNAAYDPVYDTMGRVVSISYCIPSDCSYNLKASATYDLAANITSLTYPSGRKVSFSYNSGNQLNQVQFTQWAGASVTPYTYWSASDSNFYPTGAPKLWTLGNGVNESAVFNKRLQLQQETVANSAIHTLMDHAFSYGAQGTNNGNVMSVADQLNPARTQTFTYDNLNRLLTANESRWSLGFVYDPWGNRLQQNVTSGSAGTSQLNVDNRNRIMGAPANCTAANAYCYDAAGDLLNDNFHQYTYDAESRIKQVDGGAATYTYDADGQRVRKDAPSASTEYVYFGGSIIAEKIVSNGNWTDYVFANGKRIVKADSFKDEIAVAGNNTAAGQYTWWGITGTPNVTVHTGDKLFFNHLQQGAAEGGMILTFSDGTNTSWAAQDQDGNYVNMGTVVGQWHARIADLSAYAGKTINQFLVGNSSAAPTGTWNAWYSDIAILSADGTVTPVYTGQTSASFQLVSTSSPLASNLSASVIHDSTVGANAQLTTTYYHGDQIGSSRLMTAGMGWPVWQGTFLPFGEEYNPQTSSNHYKFTGKERDSETNLDYFGARYYSNGLGRFITPDWAAKAAAVPYADFADPQSLNLYTYVRNIPTVNVDPDGHLASPWHFVITYAAAVATGHGPFHGIFKGFAKAAKNTMVDFRKGSQGTDAAHTNMHAMEGKLPNNTVQTPDQARTGTSQTIDNAMKSGDTALAGHAAIDAATPLHDGHEWQGLHLDTKTLKHLLGDLFPSPGTIKQAFENEKAVLQGVNPIAPAPNPKPTPPASAPPATPQPPSPPEPEHKQPQ